jgi:hypothetical protein
MRKGRTTKEKVYSKERKRTGNQESGDRESKTTEKHKGNL